MPEQKIEIMKNNPLSTQLNQALILFVLFIIPTIVFGQGQFSQSTGSSITISGTSTLHDWEMTSNQLSSRGNFEVNSQNQLINLSDFSFSLAVKTLKSDNQKLDNNAYKALKTDKHNEITFKARTAKVQPINSKGAVKVIGELQIAGMTKSKTFEATCTVKDKNLIRCSGTTKLLMSDFDVTPPSFMLGAMKTGDEITISYDIIYKK